MATKLINLAALLALARGDMSAVYPDTTALDARDGGCVSTPGVSTAICFAAGARASAAACAAACDAAPSCSAMTWHGPTTGEWALQCVLRLDGVWAPRACGAGCDHAAANKTAGWAPGPAPAPSPVPPPPGLAWKPSALPWGRIKAFWFGANASGLDSPDTLALIARHAVGGYGWQTGHQGGGTVGTGEELQAQASTHLRDYLDAVGALL